MFLSQTTLAAGPEADWKFWVVTCIAIAGLLLGLFQPVIGMLIKQIFERLKNGEKRFETHDKKLTRIETLSEVMQITLNEIRDEQKEEAQKTVKVQVEGAGDKAEMRVALEREFVRKEDFEKANERAEVRHGETMRAINDLRGGHR